MGRQSDRQSVAFVRALVRAGRAEIDATGMARIGAAARVPAIAAADLRRLAADGVVRIADTTCLPTAETRSWLRRQSAEADAHAAQHRTLASAEGTCVNLGESPLARLALPSGKGREPFLAPHHIEAGERIRQLTDRARLEPRTTMSYSAERVAGADRAGGAAHELTDRVIEARRALERLRDVLPADCAGVVFDVCGHLKGLQTVEIERGWPRRSAKLVLRIGLEQAAAHFGLSPRASGPDRGRQRSWLGPGARPYAFE